MCGSCLGSCLAQCGCSCVDKVCGGCKSKSGSLVPYMVLFLVGTALALVLRYWGAPLVVNLEIYHLSVCTSDKCLGIGGVNRISFALFVFFFLHAVVLKFVTSCSRIDSQSWWTKLALFIVLLVLAWLIPNSFYAVYMHISRIVSAFFLLLQLVILIDFAYTWNESWTSEQRPWQKAVLAVSVLMLLGALAFFILDLHFFASFGECHLEKFFVALTFCLTFIVTALSVSPVIAEGTGGLLPAAVLTLYSYWLLFSALTSDPSTCNTVSNRSSELAPLIIGLVLTACSVTYASWSVASNDALFSGGEREQLNSDPAAADGSGPEEVDMEKSTGKAKADDEEEEDLPTDSADAQEKAKLSSRFHLLMAAASMYICMLLSAWGSQSTAEGNSQTDLADANMWIKMATQWICLALYTWTLLAPKLCANRDFN